MLNYMLVTILEQNRIVVDLKGVNDETILLSFGFYKKGTTYTINFDNEKEQIFLIEKLARAGVLFSYGPGWAPSEVMGYLKDEGKINVPYKVIMWRSPKDYEIIDN
ncbi:hypothetical protein SAMN05192562_107174 [Kosakonia arachidis]|uniref:Uncharacterized protein n=1 Tax=Kosakonia arachidis TaxID=551989 RepID=A0A1I7DY69_9ENTR|nr:hypothetical protein [Kosakonia arachidis]SFU16629.1 hypothetical protein SAMN05192562_107174 [Kosakonia arachidis]